MAVIRILDTVVQKTCLCAMLPFRATLTPVRHFLSRLKPATSQLRPGQRATAALG
jgi:hypothetical protein